VGCYRFDRAYFHWTAVDSTGRMRATDSTGVLRLVPDSVVTVFGHHALALMPLPGPTDTAERRHWLRVSNWITLGADSVRVEWRDGFHGPLFWLRVTPSALSGTVLQTTDAYVTGVPPPQPTPASAIRIKCPS